MTVEIALASIGAGFLTYYAGKALLALVTMGQNERRRRETDEAMQCYLAESSETWRQKYLAARGDRPAYSRYREGSLSWVDVDRLKEEK